MKCGKYSVDWVSSMYFKTGSVFLHVSKCFLFEQLKVSSIFDFQFQKLIVRFSFLEVEKRKSN